MWRQDFLKKHHHHHGSKNPRIARENFGQLLKNGNVNYVILIVRVNLLPFLLLPQKHIIMEYPFLRFWDFYSIF